MPREPSLGLKPTLSLTRILAICCCPCIKLEQVLKVIDDGAGCVRESREGSNSLPMKNEDLANPCWDGMISRVACGIQPWSSAFKTCRRCRRCRRYRRCMAGTGEGIILGGKGRGPGVDSEQACCYNSGHELLVFLIPARRLHTPGLFHSRRHQRLRASKQDSRAARCRGAEAQRRKRRDILLVLCSD